MPESLAPLPDLFVERLQKVVPAVRREACLSSFAQPRPTAFRVNVLKATVDEVKCELTSQGIPAVAVKWLEGAFTVTADQRRKLTESAATAEGRIYIQSLSSMVAPVVLGPRPDEKVLDLAAAPGGKTSQMAAMMQNRGHIAAVDVVRGRMFKLRATLQRCGVSNVKTYLTDGRTVGSKTPERFDRVLLDAPCSSEARFDRREPRTWKHWSMRKIKECARKQRGLLRSAINSLKPGGTLLYCTCSFAPEENETIVHGVLEQMGEAIGIEAIDLPLENIQSGITHWEGKGLHPDVARSVRILPDGQMDGFYLCKLVKRQSTAAARRGRRPRGKRRG
jgi:16S rRNA (cytosine1407-C5)-methyltransferase